MANSFLFFAQLGSDLAIDRHGYGIDSTAKSLFGEDVHCGLWVDEHSKFHQDWVEGYHFALRNYYLFVEAR